jgi:hypothetical protein
MLWQSIRTFQTVTNNTSPHINFELLQVSSIGQYHVDSPLLTCWLWIFVMPPLRKVISSVKSTDKTNNAVVINYFIATNALHYFSVFLSLHMFRHFLCHHQGCRRQFTILNASNSLSQHVIFVSHCHWISLIFLFVVASLSSLMLLK